MFFLLGVSRVQVELCFCLWVRPRPKFNYVFTAACHVALVPISSASLERAFSQVKFIVDTVGENLLEESLETRLMECPNEY